MPDQDAQRDRDQHLDVEDLVPRLMMRDGTDGLCGHGAPGTGDAGDNRATMRENGAADNGKCASGGTPPLKNARPGRGRRPRGAWGAIRIAPTVYELPEYAMLRLRPVRILSN